MFPVKDFIRRFEGILAQLDALEDDCEPEQAEALSELNAELEDAILLLRELRPEDEDWREEFAGDMEELAALAEDYRLLSAQIPGLELLAEQLGMAAEMARLNEA